MNNSEQPESMVTARAVVQTLIAEGLRHVVLAPGSRNAPLTYALAQQLRTGSDLRVSVRIDERAAGFTALGMSLATGLPIAVVTTSGTAVGNLLPAVMEANHAGVPLLVLSADRPEDLRGTGANQTTWQTDLFGEHVRFAVDVPAGEDPARALQTGLDAACGRLAGVPKGPVQINLAFRDPLTPVPGSLDSAQAARDVGASAGQLASGGAEEPRTSGELGELVDTVAGGRALHAAAPRGFGAGPSYREVAEGAELAEVASGQPAPITGAVVVAGHGAGPVAAEFAQRLNLPLLAEPSSNARFGPNAIPAYQWLLSLFQERIDRMVVFGRPTLSRPVSALLSSGKPSAMYLPEPAPWFEAGKRPEQLVGSLAELAEFSGRGADSWLDSWQAAGSAATAHIAETLAAEPNPTGLAVAAAVWQHTAGRLVIGSSNPIRDADLAATPRQDSPLTYANRGLAGIDGTYSTAAGIALATGEPVRLLCGDLTFLHDAGGLLIPSGEAVPDLQVVLLNDLGGGIFFLLEHGGLGEQRDYHDDVERFFGTRQDVDVAHLAAAYGLKHSAVDSLAELEAELAKTISGRSVLEVRADRAQLRGLHRRLKSTVQHAARDQSSCK